MKTKLFMPGAVVLTLLVIVRTRGTSTMSMHAVTPGTLTRMRDAAISWAIGFAK